MDTNYLENNYLTLVGKVTGEKKFSHEIYGESFYIFNLMIPRLSGNSDIIPITVSERLIKEDTLQEGNKLLVKGQFRSYNSYENERNRLILTVFAKDITELEDDNEEEIEENEMVKKDMITNEVVLIGYICKKPIYRQTPFGREIADLLLAVNRAYNKSDYIPSIAWGRNARFCQNLEVGTEVKIVGRIQSRNYTAQDGSKRYVTEVLVDNLTFLGSRSDNQNSAVAAPQDNFGGNNYPANNYASDNNYTTPTDVASMPTTDISEDPFKDFGEEITLSDDDLPF